MLLCLLFWCLYSSVVSLFCLVLFVSVSPFFLLQIFSPWEFFFMFCFVLSCCENVWILKYLSFLNKLAARVFVYCLLCEPWDRKSNITKKAVRKFWNTSATLKTNIFNLTPTKELFFFNLTFHFENVRYISHYVATIISVYK